MSPFCRSPRSYAYDALEKLHKNNGNEAEQAEPPGEPCSPAATRSLSSTLHDNHASSEVMLHFAGEPPVFQGVGGEGKAGLGGDGHHRKFDLDSLVRTIPEFYHYFPVSEANIVSGHISVGAEKLPVIMCASFVSGRYASAIACACFSSVFFVSRRQFFFENG